MCDKTRETAENILEVSDMIRAEERIIAQAKSRIVALVLEREALRTRLCQQRKLAIAMMLAEASRNEGLAAT